MLVVSIHALFQKSNCDLGITSHRIMAEEEDEEREGELRERR
jgi:hypothetical protein